MRVDMCEGEGVMRMRVCVRVRVCEDEGEYV